MPSREKAIRPLLFASIAYVIAGGAIHLSEWVDGYRRIPSAVPGSWVVRIGFPVNAGISVVLAAALLYVLLRPGRLLIPVVAANFAFQAGSLAMLIATRMTSVFGWSEPSWTPGANRARGAEIGALLVLSLTALCWASLGRNRSRKTSVEPAYSG